MLQAEQLVSFIPSSSALPAFHDVDYLPCDSGWR